MQYSLAMKGKSQRSRRRPGRPSGEDDVVLLMLAATREEFGQAGLEGLSVERVAQRAGVYKTSIYRRWPTREALVAAAFELLTDDVASRLPEAVSFRTAVTEIFQDVAKYAGHPIGRAVFLAHLVRTPEPERSADAVERLEQRVSCLVLKALDQEQRRGEMREGVVVERLVHTLLGAIVYRALRERAVPSKKWVAAQVNQALDGALRR